MLSISISSMSRVLLEKLISAQLVKKIPTFIEPECSVLCSKAITATISFPDDDVCTSQPHALFL
jgi:hypothetical protein